MPIIASTGELLGTFAHYYRCIRQPSEAELQQIERSTYLTSIAIERAKVRESLESNLHFLKILIDTIPNPVFYKNTDGEYLGCNRSFLNAFGLSEAEVIGKSFFDLARQELAELFAEKDRALLTTAGIHVYESSVMPILTRHGETSQDFTLAGLPFEEMESRSSPVSCSPSRRDLAGSAPSSVTSRILPVRIRPPVTTPSTSIRLSATEH
jgi:PAS domain S-box-containing protein